MNIVAKATEQKSLFESSVENIKDALDSAIVQAESKATQRTLTENALPPAKTSATGWLRGALSYPWVFACSLIPSLEDLL